MTVIALKPFPDRQPTLVTLFCVKSYWNDRGNLAEGRLQQFFSVEAALRAARAAADRAPAVRVVRVRGNAEADYWEEPVSIARFGDRATELPGAIGAL